MKRCLACYLPLGTEEGALHAACSRKFFRQPMPPDLPYAEDELEHLARQVLQSRITLPGVQPKISLQLGDRSPERPAGRLTIVGLWGDYILKPPTPLYPGLPEVEDMTMHLARLARIKTVPHSLIHMRSGTLAYVTKRVDRTPKGKLAMEDMCQLTGRMTEEKYFGSYEQVAKTLKQYSVNPGLDLVNFYEVVLFSFLTGNADMHLKNFSLLEQPGAGMMLSPAYDLVNTALVNPADTEDLALTLNGRKRKITRHDMDEAMQRGGLQSEQRTVIFRKMAKARPLWLDWLGQGFLSNELLEGYREILEKRFARMYGQ